MAASEVTIPRSFGFEAFAFAAGWSFAVRHGAVVGCKRRRCLPGGGLLAWGGRRRRKGGGRMQLGGRGREEGRGWWRGVGSRWRRRRRKGGQEGGSGGGTRGVAGSEAGTAREVGSRRGSES